MESRVSMVTLSVKDLKKSTEFYENLGFKKAKVSQDTVTFFVCPGTILGLYPKLAQDVGIVDKRGNFSGITLGYNTKSQEEVQEIFDKAIKLGGKSTKEPQDAFWGGYHCYFADLDGFHWEVAWNPYFKFDKQNNIQLE